MHRQLDGRVDTSPSAAPVRAPGATSAALLASAVGLGVYADVGQRLDGVLGTVPELGTPWVGLAFAAGLAWHRRPPVALLLGPGVILVGLVSYWTFMRVAHGTPVYNLTNDGRGLFWVSAAAVLGALGALAGSLAGSGAVARRAAGWGLAAAVPLAEAARVLHDDLGPSPGVLSAGLGAVASAAWWLGVRRCTWWALALTVTSWTVAGVGGALFVLPIVR